MIRRKKRRRIMAIMLVIMMVVSMLPSNFIANAEESACTVTLQDSDGKVLSGVTVKYIVTGFKTVDGEKKEVTINGEAITGEDGVAKLDKISEEIDGASISDGFTIDIIASKEGYADKKLDQQTITSISALPVIKLSSAYTVTVTEQSTGKNLCDAMVTYSLYKINADDSQTLLKADLSATTNEEGIAYLAEIGQFETDFADSNIIMNGKVEKNGYCNYEISDTTINSVSGGQTVELEKNAVGLEIISGNDINISNVNIKVNGNEVPSEISKDQEHSLSVTANEGYIITSLTINNEEQLEADTVLYSGKIEKPTDDVTIKITLFSVYKVTVSANENGSFTTTPACEGGQAHVYVKANGKLTLTASPNPHYRVSKVEKVVENQLQPSQIFTENDKSYSQEHEITAKTDFIITFEKNNYTITSEIIGADTCQVYFNGDVNQTTCTAEYGSTPQIYVEQNNDFLVDSVEIERSKPDKNVVIDMQPSTNDSMIMIGTIPSLEQDETVKITYKPVDKIAPEDNQLEKAGYYAITFSQDPVRNITKNGQQVVVLPKGTQIKIAPTGDKYVQIALSNGRESKIDIIVSEDVHIDGLRLYYDKKTYDFVSPMNLTLVVDDKAPEASYQINSKSTNSYYTGDVAVMISGTEKDEQKFSGIKTLQYWITVGDEKIEEEKVKTVYSYEGDTQPLQSVARDILIDADTYDCNNIKLTVRTEDLAGNVSMVESDFFNIDASAPQVSLTYDNNSCKNSRYFNTPRTATVVVTEREKGFDKENASKGIIITAQNAVGQDIAYAYTISDWVTNVNFENDNLTTHTANIVFSEDANYTVSMQFKDAAGNTNTAIDTGSSVAPYRFTVDTKEPNGSVTAVSGEGRKQTWTKLTDSLTLGYYSREKITVSGVSEDETSGIKSIKYYKQVKKSAKNSLKLLTAAELDAITTWEDFKGFTISEDEEFIVYLKIVDNAENYTYVSTDGLIVDDKAPIKEIFEPKVTIEPEQPVNGFYNKDVSIKVKVEDPEVNGTFTGLKRVSYKVYNEIESKTEPTQEAVLYEFTTKNPTSDDLVQTWDGNIKVDSSKNNSNDIVVEVYAEDNAGNAASYTKKLKIDTTAPTVNVKYSNNNAVSGKYFDDIRVATIEITERNFNENDLNITITNSDGTVPKVSKWKKAKGRGNGDDTRWIATITYAKDGAYTFKISYKDRAGNKCESVEFAENTVAAKEFIVDRTRPEISVSYDNNKAYNGEYYSAARRATLVVTEHNFDPERVDTVITAQENGEAISVPALSGWSTNGDVHTATISYSNDARYTFDVTVTDLAGNVAADFTEQSFCIDQTAPKLEITGVEDKSANAGDVIPVVAYSDANFDVSALQIKLVGANRNEVELDGSYDNSNTGGSFTFKNFVRQQEIDDIYVLSATLKDKAGNTVSEEITFSVNRFGSTYDFSDRTTQINGNYIQSAEDIVVIETNPTELSDIKVTLFQNNETMILKEERDYKIQLTGGNGQWYYYTYTINKEVFKDDGIYKLVFHSKDSAGNIAENVLETKDAEISFGVDRTKPNIIVANLESQKTYALEEMTVVLTANDNLRLKEILVYLDGKVHAEWKDESLESLIDQNGELTFDVEGTSNRAHDVKIICRDAAGNEAVEEITDFYVTTNLWVRFFNNKPLFYGSIASVFLIIGFIVFFVVRRREKKS